LKAGGRKKILGLHFEYTGVVEKGSEKLGGKKKNQHRITRKGRPIRTFAPNPQPGKPGKVSKKVERELEREEKKRSRRGSK